MRKTLRKKVMMTSMNDRRGRFVALGLILFTLAYGLFQARVLLEGPELTVRAPVPGASLTEPLMEVRGKAHNVTRVTINGRPITTTPEGDFNDTLVTPSGYGVVLVEATNRFGYHIEERIEIYGAPMHTEES